MIKHSYEGIVYRVICDGQLTKKVEIRTGVIQGCLLSPFLFVLATVWSSSSSFPRAVPGIWGRRWGC